MTWNDPLTWQNAVYSEIDRIDWLAYKCEGNPVHIPTYILELLSAYSEKEANDCRGNLAGRVTQCGEIIYDSAIPCVTCVMTYFAKSSDLVKYYILMFLGDVVSTQDESEIVTACLLEIERGIHDLFSEMSHGIHKNKIYATEIVARVCLASSDRELLMRALWYLEQFGVNPGHLLLTTSVEEKIKTIQRRFQELGD